jgi:hypothetical protein
VHQCSASEAEIADKVHAVASYYKRFTGLAIYGFHRRPCSFNPMGYEQAFDSAPVYGFPPEASAPHDRHLGLRSIW